MKDSIKCCLFILALALPSIAMSQQPASPLPPVPPALTSAKTAFLSNGGADSGLFPSPFSGDTNRPYAEFYTALQSSGAFQLVSDPTQADLVLELQLLAPTGPTNANKQNGTAD